MNIQITDKCIKCGICSEINGEIFEINKDGAIFNSDKYKDTFEDDCFDALLYCPVFAIKLI